MDKNQPPILTPPWLVLCAGLLLCFCALLVLSWTTPTPPRRPLDAGRPLIPEIQVPTVEQQSLEAQKKYNQRYGDFFRRHREAASGIADAPVTDTRPIEE